MVGFEREDAPAGLGGVKLALLGDGNGAILGAFDIDAGNPAERFGGEVHGGLESGHGLGRQR